MPTRAARARRSKADTQEPKPSSKAQPAKHGGQARRTADEAEDALVVNSKGTTGTPRIQWNSMRTERLLEWLENNVEDRQRLFSDSAQDAKEDNRRCRTAKSAKTSFYIEMAKYIFSVDEDERVRDDLKAHGPLKFAKVVENRINK
jgi:hypothetical protein